MKLYPAIDILDNRSVRLLHGKRSQVTDYGSPALRADLWIEQGAERLHIVDLNGAFDDSLVNDRTLRELIRGVSVPIQIGGGVKSLDRVQYYLDELGADSVIIGSALVTDYKMAEAAYSRYGSRIVAGIDAIDNKVCIKGWVEQSDITPLQLASRVKEYGADRIIFTDISRDGALSGVNVSATAELQRQSGVNIVASGGLKDINDISALISESVYGVILGRAIYTGAIDLREAARIAKGDI